jgi:hypothetical protein
MAMRIGLDYGGVISFAPDGWARTIGRAKERGHEVYLISHAQKGQDLQKRHDYATSLGIVDLSFADFESATQERQIAERKAELCRDYGIEIFIDDDLHRCEAVGRLCVRCAALYVPQNLWQVGQRLVDGLSADGEWR